MRQLMVDLDFWGWRAWFFGQHLSTGYSWKWSNCFSGFSDNVSVFSEFLKVENGNDSKLKIQPNSSTYCLWLRDPSHKYLRKLYTTYTNRTQTRPLFGCDQKNGRSELGSWYLHPFQELDGFTTNFNWSGLKTIYPLVNSPFSVGNTSSHFPCSSQLC